MFLRILLVLILLGLAVLIPFNYYYLIGFSVTTLKLGWVFSTIFLRLMVMILFTLALNLTFDFFKRTRKMKFVFVILIGMVGGFGISFLAPIYDTDYGDLSDQMILEDPNVLTELTGGAYQPNGERHIVGFFSVDCSHCKNVTAKIGINQLAGQKVEVHSFFHAPVDRITGFLEENYGQEFHSYQMTDAETFLSISGFEMPSIFLLDRDESTMKHWTGDVVNYSTLDYLLELEP